MEVLNVTDTIYIYLHRRQNRRASSSEIYSSFDEITESAYISAQFIDCDFSCVASQKQWCNLFNLPAAQTPYVYMVRITIFGELLIEKLSNTNAYCLA